MEKGKRNIMNSDWLSGYLLIQFQMCMLYIVKWDEKTIMKGEYDLESGGDGLFEGTPHILAFAWNV
jgi:hypothetical protein